MMNFKRKYSNCWRFIKTCRKNIFSKISIILVFSIILSSLLSACSVYSDNTLINVSYDPTRSFYVAYNELFQKHWQDKTGESVDIIQSHGGSGSQATSVINGLEADVVTLALSVDVNAISEEGLISPDWETRYNNASCPYNSTIVFLVRKGNPKNILDWDDLVKDNVAVITPNPKTSGGARWNYIAGWSYASEKYNGDEEQVLAFMKKLYSNVISLSSGARGATADFVENGQGDVLIAWENEALQSVADNEGEYEIVTPSISVLAQPSVSLVDSYVKKHKTQELSNEYLSYLYSDEAQRLMGKYYYRPSNEEILKEFSDVFNINMKLVNIKDLGGWSEVNKKHFADGGTFDKIYE